MASENVLKTKSFAFAVRIVNHYPELRSKYQLSIIKLSIICQF